MFLIPNVVQGRYFEGEISDRFGLPKYIRESVCGTEIQALFVESGFLSFGIQNSTQGIRNPANDWNPESKFHWQGIRNPETTAWSPVSTTSLDYLTWGKFGQILKLVSTGHGKNSTNLGQHEQTLWQINLEVHIICIEYILWLSKIIYYSFKIFPRFWLAKSSRMIHYNQLLMTKFGRILCLTRKWRQKCSVLAG